MGKNVTNKGEKSNSVGHIREKGMGLQLRHKKRIRYHP